MNLEQLRTYTRQHVLRDVPLPQQWSDADLTFWLNEAEGRIARETHIFVDGENDLTQISTTVDESVCALDPRILVVSSVSRDAFLLRKFAARATSLSSTAGPPQRWTQRGVGALVLWPTPDAVYDLQMIVARLPLTPMADADPDADPDEVHDTPELPEQYHTTLCLWAGLQAVLNTDTQGANDIKAATKSMDERWGKAVVEIKREVFQQQWGR